MQRESTLTVAAASAVLAGLAGAAASAPDFEKTL
jgi:hypothetical protein